MTLAEVPSQPVVATVKEENPPSASTNGVSSNFLSNDTAHARRFRKLLDELVALGIEKLIDVPKIAIVGSQSAGKSSILELSSGSGHGAREDTVQMNRASLDTLRPSLVASGTCTRCPSEVRLFRSKEDWNATVSLRFEKDSKGRPLANVSVVPFGDVITDPAKMQQAASSRAAFL